MLDHCLNEQTYKKVSDYIDSECVWSLISLIIINYTTRLILQHCSSNAGLSFVYGSSKILQ